MNQDCLLEDVAVEDIEDLDPSTGEVQLLAMISNKECICYAIKVKDRDYLMFTDNKITYDFIKSNQNIVVMEDDSPKAINLIYLDNGFIQKTFENITVSFVRYSWKLNLKNVIKYNDNYFSTVFNSILKKYERHLVELEKDINYFDLNPKPITTTSLTTTKIASTGNFDNISAHRRCECCRRCCGKCLLYLCVAIIFLIAMIIIGILDKYVDFDSYDDEYGDDDDW